MQIFLLILFQILVFASMFAIFTAAAKIPARLRIRGLTSAGKAQKNIQKRENDVIIETLAGWIEPLVMMDPIRERRLQSQLSVTGSGTSARHYAAECIAVALILGGVFFIPALFFPLSLPPLGLALYLYYRFLLKRPQRMLARKRADLEAHLARMASNIAQHLRTSRDVLRILEHFSKTTSGSLYEELAITTADMRSGSYELALMRLDSRIVSPLLSQIVRGLIAVIRGDDARVYFEMLAQDFRALEIANLKKEVMRRSPRIQQQSLLLLIAFITMTIGMLGYYAVKQMGEFL